MRIRTIKPEFWTDEDLSSISEAALILAIALLNYADDEGYFKANPLLIRAAIFPIRKPSSNIPVMLHELSKSNFIRLGTDKNGHELGHVVHFMDHQCISHPKPSKLKAGATFHEQSSNIPVSIHEESILNGMEWNGMELNICAEPEQSSNIPVSIQEESILICAEPEIPVSAPTSKIFLEFPIKASKGKSKIWALTESKVQEYEETYDGMDVESELRKARHWCIDNPAKRKTSGGMAAFLTRWLGRANDSGKSLKQIPGTCPSDVERTSDEIQAMLRSVDYESQGNETKKSN